jgi:hypothetical protein
MRLGLLVLYAVVVGRWLRRDGILAGLRRSAAPLVSSAPASVAVGDPQVATI